MTHGTPQSPKPHVGTTEVLPLLTTETFYFGRHYAEDQRDERFRMASVAPVSIDLARDRHWLPGKVLDQGATSSCVGHAAKGFLEAIPTRRTKGEIPGPMELYYGAQQHDEWEGSSYDGTSVRGAFKYMQSLGKIREYRWALTVDELIAFVLTRGTVIFGLPWARSMLYPESNGVITNDKRYVGGHAVLITGYSHNLTLGGVTGNWFRLRNSWGTAWGDTGKCWISETDVRYLFEHEWVEACSGIEL